MIQSQNVEIQLNQIETKSHGQEMDKENITTTDGYDVTFFYLLFCFCYFFLFK